MKSHSIRLNDVKLEVLVWSGCKADDKFRAPGASRIRRRVQRAREKRAVRKEIAAGEPQEKETGNGSA